MDWQWWLWPVADRWWLWLGAVLWFAGTLWCWLTFPKSKGGK